MDCVPAGGRSFFRRTDDLILRIMAVRRADPRRGAGKAGRGRTGGDGWCGGGARCLTFSTSQFNNNNELLR